jgi:hypothetical protein
VVGARFGQRWGNRLFCASAGLAVALGFWIMVGSGTAEMAIALSRKTWTHRMQTVYDFVSVICFICIVLTYFMFTEGGMKVLAHFMLPAAAFAIANQVGNHAGSDVPMNILAVVLIVAGIGYTFIIVRHSPA